MASRIGLILLALIMALCVIFIGRGLLADSNEHEELAAEFGPGKFVSGEICGACHKEIYEVWSQHTIHAQSVKDPIFQAGLKQAMDTHGETIRETCLSCHAPTTNVTKDYALSTALSQEGVTCDFCHSVTDVRLEKRASGFPYVLDVGLVKRGPLADAQGDIHDVEYGHSLDHGFDYGEDQQWDDRPHDGLDRRQFHRPVPLRLLERPARRRRNGCRLRWQLYRM